MSKFLDFISSPFTGDINALEQGIKEGYNINEADLNLLTNSIIFGDGSNYEYIDKLIEYGIDINQKTENDRNGLFYSCGKPDLYLVKKLLENGIKVNQVDINGDNALMYMCRTGMSKQINRGLDKKDTNVLGSSFILAQNNKESEYNYTQERIDIINTLISSGLNVTQLNDIDYSVLDLAVKYAENDVVKALAQRGLQQHQKENIHGLNKIILARRMKLIKKSQNKNKR